MINFKAKYIHSTDIIKRNGTRDFVNHQVAFVEIEPTNYDDVLAVNSANINWDYGETLSTYIAQSINQIFRKTRQEKEKRFFALTQQKDKFEKLESDEILGLVEVSKLNENTQEIDYIQLNPKYLGKVRDFIKMGNAIINSIKKLYPNKILELSSNGSAFNFYRRNGFLPLNNFGRMRFIP